jgi:hypothetical protein
MFLGSDHDNQLMLFKNRGGYAARLSRKTTSLRFGKLRLGTQFMTPGGPVFALSSFAAARNVMAPGGFSFAEASARQAVRGVERRFMGGLKSEHQALGIRQKR